MEELMNVLKEIDEDIDFEMEDALIDDGLLDSFAVIRLIAELEEAFEVTIEATELIPENFNSAERMWKMIQRLMEEQ